jgi:hypothetical protein
MSLSQGISIHFRINVTPTLKGEMPISIKIFNLFIVIDKFPEIYPVPIGREG